MIRHTFDAALDRAAELAIDPLIGDRFAWQSTAPRARYCRLAEIGATRAAPVFERREVTRRGDKQAARVGRCHGRRGSPAIAANAAAAARPHSQYSVATTTRH